MADMGLRRESRRVARAWSALGRGFTRMLDCVPTDCPLCLGRSCGGAPCSGCGEDMRALSAAHRCGRCALALAPAQHCPDCAVLKPAFERVVTAFDYVPPVDQLIFQLKNRARFQHARFLAAALAQTLTQVESALDGVTIMVPVPSSRQALRRRGFNPAGEIARRLASRLELPYRPVLLCPTGKGASQKHLGRAARTRSREGHYLCSKRIDAEVVAVVDDVLTTGATMHAAAQALLQAGAQKVVGIVVARTPYR